MQNTYKKEFPAIMGVLNVTPDSFSDGGSYLKLESAVRHAMSLLEQGATMIDVGGESTRPNAKPVTSEVEIKRVVPVISEIKRLVPDCHISVDTTKYDVALAAVNAGADMINDVSGLYADERLAALAAANDVSLVIMHMKGTPQSMQDNPQYENVVKEVYDFLVRQVAMAVNAGVRDVIIDVGIGFGKTLEHNLELLKNLEVFGDINARMMLGISRKSFLGKLTGIEEPIDRDFATALMHALLLDKPVDIIRVHNVNLIRLLQKLYSAII